MPNYAAGLARVLSKRGICSRAQARETIKAGRVRVNGRLIRDPDFVVDAKAVIDVEGHAPAKSATLYVILNKPRGLVTTTADEHGRQTVYECFAGAQLPRIIPVGRLDQASEGLLLFTNDNDWAARITNPESKITKTYHVQVNRVADAALIEQIKAGEDFKVRRADILRTGERNSWLEIVLDEGKNRHIRRLLEAFEIEVLRLIRVRIGSLELGDLPKGQWRKLTEAEQRRIFIDER